MLKDLKEGDTFPDFELPDETGVLHRLSELQAEKPMVLQLGRGEHCPRERQHHRELLTFHEWCATAVTELVTIVPNTRHDTLKLKMTTGAHWTFLADENLEVRSALGIEEYVDSRHTASVPHTVVLAPGLEIFKIYVGFWFWGRPSIYDLWADLRDLRRKFDYNFDPLAPGVREAWEAMREAAKAPARTRTKREPAKRRRAARRLAT
jgi:peroxiredoxin